MAKIKKHITEDITPAHRRCSYGGCPAVFTLSDGDLLIIGKVPSPDILDEINGRVAADEHAVKISPEFFKNLLK